MGKYSTACPAIRSGCRLERLLLLRRSTMLGGFPKGQRQTMNLQPSWRCFRRQHHGSLTSDAAYCPGTSLSWRSHWAKTVLKSDVPGRRLFLVAFDPCWSQQSWDTTLVRSRLIHVWAWWGVQERVGKFRRWLMEQPEKTVVVFGHSTMLRELIGGDKHLRNCELYTMQV